ncbi:diguanylate cyclase (GGDEF)-like protein [Tahibacter aquaticus]|uniref:diguanylate cyclase n=1 Tax=Tahibacter aquaticus TaxID=520092 RepID=A0A4R6YYN7_9GAMM|nr:diguanylate cyclase [Tahibacter aquaticus]TDR44092.1 diguanylate cyclase (GGDEF)-like protein [Tahibacter aquaticus]
MPIRQSMNPLRRQALTVVATALLVCGFGTMSRLYADDLSPATAGQLAASAQSLSQALQTGWHTLDSLLGPSLGRPGRLHLARTVGVLEQSLGASFLAAEAWKAAVAHATRLNDLPRLIEALDHSVALALARGDYDGASALAANLLQEARHLRSTAAQAAAEGYLGVIARRRGKLEEARQHQETALELRRRLGDKAGEAQVLMNLGTVHRDLGDFARALEFQIDALELRRSLGSQEKLDLSYRNIALLYREIEDTEQARVNFEAALASSRKNYDPQSLAGALGSYASFSNDIGEAEAALTMARQARAIDASIGNRPYVGLENVEIGRALIRLGRDDEAAVVLNEALLTGRELKHREITGGALLYLGRIALRAGNETLATQHLDEAIRVLTEAGLKSALSEAFGAREEIALASGQLAAAIDFSHRRAALREELLGTRSGRQLAALKSRYERADADQRIRLLSLSNELQNLRLNQQALLRNIGLGAAAVLSVLLALLFRRYRTTRTLNRQLQQKNAEISAHEATLESANAKLSTHAAELYQAAITDPLTGAYNRGHLLRQLDDNLRHALAAQQDLSLLLIDFDHFKTVNDEHGHLFGDRVLASGIQIVRQWLEPGDLIGRYGGEEFVVVMPGRDVQSGLAVAERLRDKVASGLDALAQGKRSLTISIGLASLGSSGARTLEDLLGAADIAVYRAKAQGRNRVVRYAPETGVAAIATP